MQQRLYFADGEAGVLCQLYQPQPFDVVLAIISAAGNPSNVRHQADPLVITQGRGGNAELFGNGADHHMDCPPLGRAID